MKKLIVSAVALVALATTVSMAGEVSTSSYVRTVSASPCSFWTSIRDANGMFAYACSSYSMSLQIPDGYDLQRVIDAQDSKIAELERRIAELEKKN